MMQNTTLRARIHSLSIATLLATLLVVAPFDVTAEEASFDHEHGAFNGLLKRHVKQGRVDYSALRAGSKAQLTQYLGTLQGVTKAQYGSWSRNQKLAFWINAYNAYTLSIVVDNMPVQSIMKIAGGNGAAFKRRFIPLGHLGGGGAKVSLNDVENRIIRPGFREPRIHFALVCAAKSCPTLRSEAYRAPALNRQLEQQTRAFIRNSKANRYDSGSNTLHLSRIFEWYAEDFQRGSSTVPRFVARYLGDDANTAIQATEPRVSYLEYDWSLNGR